MARIKMHISKAKLPFYPPCEVKCRLQNGVSTVKRSEARFKSRQLDSVAPPSLSTPFQSAPSTSTPSSSTSDASLRNIMAQLQHMDARLDTLFPELYQVNVRVGRIAQRQAIIGGFAPEASPPPPLVASDSEDEDDGDDNDASDDDDDDGDAISTDEMST